MSSKIVFDGRYETILAVSFPLPSLQENKGDWNNEQTRQGLTYICFVTNINACVLHFLYLYYSWYFAFGYLTFFFYKKGTIVEKVLLWQESSDQLLLISSWQRNFAKKSMIVTNHTKKRLSIEKKNILGRERNSFLLKLHLLRSSHFIEISTIWRK